MASADMTVHIADLAPVRAVLDAVVALVHDVDASGDARYAAHVERICAALREVPARTEPVPDDLREALAALAHDQWSGWLTYMMTFIHQNDIDQFVLDADKHARWQRQMNTDYAQLPDEEKESDRAEADRVLALLAQHGKYSG